MRELTIHENDAGQRLDKFLSKAVPGLPKSLMYKSIRTKKIKRNRKRTQPEEILEVGDVLQLFLSEDIFGETADKPALDRIRPAFGVVYEDENILLCEKKPGMLSQPEAPGDSDTLADHVKAYLCQKGEYDPQAEQSFAPALCNRLDRNTAGLVIAAKNAEALRDMNEIIRVRNLKKTYLCAVHGTFANQRGTLRGTLTKDSESNRVRVYAENQQPKEGDAKTIVTGYEVLKQNGDLALLEVELITGRTHQIRAHFASIGHPLLGDGKYGVNKEDRKAGYRYQALYAYSVTFGTLEGKLSYLSGKRFAVPKSHIDFLSLFETEKR